MHRPSALLAGLNSEKSLGSLHYLANNGHGIPAKPSALRERYKNKCASAEEIHDLCNLKLVARDHC
jgi:hypothetical protein